MKFVDFGDCDVVRLQDIRLLPTQFQQLPCLAVNVKLQGMSHSKLCSVVRQRSEKNLFVSRVYNMHSRCELVTYSTSFAITFVSYLL